MRVVSYSEAARIAGVSRQAIYSLKKVNADKGGKYPFFCHSPIDGKAGIDIDNREFVYYLNRNEVFRVKASVKKTTLNGPKQKFKNNGQEKKNNGSSILDIVADQTLVKFLEKQLERIAGFEEIGLPEQGEQIVLVSDQSFNAMTFLMNIIEAGRHVEELVLSFYSFNLKAMEIVEALMSAEVIDKYVFQTSTLRKYGSDAKIPQKLSSMIKKFGADRVSGNFVNSHAKILMAKCGEDFFIVEGSGNMSEKIRTEQYLLDNSAKIYDFHHKWITGYDKREDIK